MKINERTFFLQTEHCSQSNKTSSNTFKMNLINVHCDPLKGENYGRE